MSTIITAAVSFFAVPLLIRVLGAEMFGRWSLLEPLQLIVSQAMLVGLTYGIVKLINFDKLHPYTTFMTLLRGAQPLLIMVTVATYVILPLIGFSKHESGWFALLVYVEAIVLLLLAAFRAAGAVKEYSAGSIIRVLVFLAVLMVTMFTGRLLIVNVGDVLVWRLAAAIAGISVCFRMFKKSYKVTCNDPKPPEVTTGRLYRDAFRYGSPILVTSLLAMVIEVADRYVLKAYFDYTTLAHYVVYMKIAAFLNPTIIGPFSIWWPTERFRRHQTPDGGMAFFRRTALLMLTVLLLTGGVLWFISPWLITWFAPGIPLSSEIILLLIASVIFMGMGTPLNIGLLEAGRTHLNIYGALCGAFIHIIFCFLLIPNFGILGAAGATALSYLAYTVLLNLLSQNVMPIPFAYYTMLLLLASSFAELLAIQSIVNRNNLEGCSIKIVLYMVSFTVSAVAILWREKIFKSAISAAKHEVICKHPSINRG